MYFYKLLYREFFKICERVPILVRTQITYIFHVNQHGFLPASLSRIVKQLLQGNKFREKLYKNLIYN